MEKNDTRDNCKRISDLEMRVDEQAAQIEGLVASLALVVMAHVVINKDARIPSRLAEQRDYDFQREREGGTRRVNASFFKFRGSLYQDILEEMRTSDFLRKYWVRSIFPKREERRLKKIERIEALLATHADVQ